MASQSKRPQKPNNFLPPIETLSDAQKVARMGTWAACFVTGMTALLAIASIVGVLPSGVPINGWALIDAGIFGAIAWGIYQMSRVAAVAGLVVYIAERIYMQVAAGAQPGAGLIVSIFITLAFINAVRGTFAYHRMKKVDASSL
ncbi:MAG: hypothetical protein KME16_02345 [Scytolyngbya sp. HA4215-MV1]|nr:hypothetical protein [Scytolyngbya sp. HA4215-MV1]